MKAGDDLGYLIDRRVLVSVVGDGFPKGHRVAVDHDRLVYVDGADRWIVHRFEPPGDIDRSAWDRGVGVGACYPGDYGRFKPVDGVGAESQQTGAGCVHARACGSLLEDGPRLCLAE